MGSSGIKQEYRNTGKSLHYRNVGDVRVKDKMAKVLEKHFEDTVQVENMDRRMDEHRLRELFSRFGEITEVKLKIPDSPHSSKSLNSSKSPIGYVSFKSETDAHRAAEEEVEVTCIQETP